MGQVLLTRRFVVHLSSLLNFSFVSWDKIILQIIRFIALFELRVVYFSIILPKTTTLKRGKVPCNQIWLSLYNSTTRDEPGCFATVNLVCTFQFLLRSSASCIKILCMQYSYCENKGFFFVFFFCFCLLLKYSLKYYKICFNMMNDF